MQEEVSRTVRITGAHTRNVSFTAADDLQQALPEDGQRRSRSPQGDNGDRRGIHMRCSATSAIYRLAESVQKIRGDELRQQYDWPKAHHLHACGYGNPQS